MNADPRLPRWTEEGSEAPAELQQWLRASRAGTAPDEIAQLAQSLAQRLGPEAGLAAAMSQAPAAAAGLLFGAGRWAAWLAAGVSSMAAVWYLASDHSTPAHSPAPVAAPVIAAPAIVAPPVSELPAPERAEVVAAPTLESARPALPERAAPARQPAPKAAARSEGQARSSEAALLERAQHALEAHPSQALALTAQHRRLFARGALAEEREAIAIEALRRLGREREAGERAAVFAAKYPNSVHRARVEGTPAQPGR